MNHEGVIALKLHLSGLAIELLRLVSEGMQNREIAERLHLSLSHVEKKLSNADPTRSIYNKIGVRRRAEAIAWYDEQARQATDLNAASDTRREGIPLTRLAMSGLLLPQD